MIVPNPWGAKTEPFYAVTEEDDGRGGNAAAGQPRDAMSLQIVSLQIGETSQRLEFFPASM